MDKLFSSVQTFFQSVTSNDRYADINNNNNSNTFGRRTVSGGFGPAAPLTSDEGSDLSHSGHNPYGSYSNSSSRNGSTTNLASASNSSLNRLPYTPGMRSARVGSSGTNQGHSNIPLQDYNDGAPPPPPPSLSWKRIDRYLDLAYPELGDQLEDPVTNNDLNEFESDLGFSLPGDVRDSFLVHDGQERGGRPTGVIFGITLLDLEAVAAEWENWKNTAIKVGNMAKAAQANRMMQQEQAQMGRGGPSSSSHSPPGPSRRPGGPKPPANRNSGNLTWLDYQESIPEGAIQKVYAHPAWIPLATDYLGNNIAVDLAPGPNGKWGQVILFGREFDRKFVVASSWSAFLMMFADDLENGRHLVEDETEDGVFLFRAPNGNTIPYFDVLKSRTARKYRNQVRQQQQQQKDHGKTQPQQHGNSPYGNYRQSSNPNLAGSNSSPRNSMGSPVAGPGRNVSAGFKPHSRPSQISTIGGGVPGPAGNRVSNEGKLISPISSSSHLPSVGLRKPVIPPNNISLTSPLSTTTSADNKADIYDDTIAEESADAPKEAKDSLAQQNEPVSEEAVEKPEVEESNPVSKDISTDADVPTTPAAASTSASATTPVTITTTPATTTTTDASETDKPEEPKKFAASEEKDTTANIADSKLSSSSATTDAKPSAAAVSKDDKSDSTDKKAKDSEKPDFSKIEIKDDDSEDEVDLLKDELTEVAI